MRISDWSSDVCSSDLGTFIIAFGDGLGVDHRLGAHVVGAGDELGHALRPEHRGALGAHLVEFGEPTLIAATACGDATFEPVRFELQFGVELVGGAGFLGIDRLGPRLEAAVADLAARSEEHTSDLQSLMRISYAVFCLK